MAGHHQLLDVGDEAGPQPLDLKREERHCAAERQARKGYYRMALGGPGEPVSGDQ